MTSLDEGKSRQPSCKTHRFVFHTDNIVTLLNTYLQSLLETVKKGESQAHRDNDLIYHQDVPSPSALTAIQEAKLVSSTIPKGLQNPSSVLGTRHQLFSELAGWGSREAISELKPIGLRANS